MPSTPFCASQKLCSTGDRECETGQPMMPASRVLPVILIAPRSLLQRAESSQKLQQLKQGQAENSEIVAAHPTEQLHPAAFQAIGTHRGEQSVALADDIL